MPSESRLLTHPDPSSDPESLASVIVSEATTREAIRLHAEKAREEAERLSRRALSLSRVASSRATAADRDAYISDALITMASASPEDLPALIDSLKTRLSESSTSLAAALAEPEPHSSPSPPSSDLADLIPPEHVDPSHPSHRARRRAEVAAALKVAAAATTSTESTITTTSDLGVSPEEAAALRASILAHITDAISDVPLVMRGLKSWSSNQTRLFQILLDRVLPPASQSMTTAKRRETKEFSKLTREDLERIAAGEAIDIVGAPVPDGAPVPTSSGPRLPGRPPKLATDTSS